MQLRAMEHHLCCWIAVICVFGCKFDVDLSGVSAKLSALCDVMQAVCM